MAKQGNSLSKMSPVLDDPFQIMHPAMEDDPAVDPPMGPAPESSAGSATAEQPEEAAAKDASGTASPAGCGPTGQFSALRGRYSLRSRRSAKSNSGRSMPTGTSERSTPTGSSSVTGRSTPTGRSSSTPSLEVDDDKGDHETYLTTDETSAEGAGIARPAAAAVALSEAARRHDAAGSPEQELELEEIEFGEPEQQPQDPPQAPAAGRSRWGQALETLELNLRARLDLPPPQRTLRFQALPSRRSSLQDSVGEHGEEDQGNLEGPGNLEEPPDSQRREPPVGRGLGLRPMLHVLLAALMVFNMLLALGWRACREPKVLKGLGVAVFLIGLVAFAIVVATQ